MSKNCKQLIAMPPGLWMDSFAVLCSYLGGDLSRIRASVLLGSIVPLLALLIWDAIALGLSEQVDQVADPVERLMRSFNFWMCSLTIQ